MLQIHFFIDHFIFSIFSLFSSTRFASFQVVEVARQSEAQSLSFEDTETWGKLQKLGQAGQVRLSDNDSIHCVHSFLIVSHHFLILR